MEKHLCLYTKRLTQKQKKWQDGRVALDRSSGRLVLMTEEGETVHTAHLKPADIGGWAEDDELRVEEKFLIMLGAPFTDANTKAQSHTSTDPERTGPAAFSRGALVPLSRPSTHTNAPPASSLSLQFADEPLVKRGFLAAPRATGLRRTSPQLPPLQHGQPSIPADYQQPNGPLRHHHQQQHPSGSAEHHLHHHHHQQQLQQQQHTQQQPQQQPRYPMGQAHRHDHQHRNVQQQQDGHMIPPPATQHHLLHQQHHSLSEPSTLPPLHPASTVVANSQQTRPIPTSAVGKWQPPYARPSSTSCPSSAPAAGESGAGHVVASLGLPQRSPPEFRASTQSLEFITAAIKNGLQPVRHVDIFDTFTSAQSYCQLLRRAITEEANLLLADVAARFLHATKRIASTRGQSSTGTTNVMASMRRFGGCLYYDEVEVIVSRKRARASDDDERGGEADAIGGPRTFLRLRHMPNNTQAEDYNRGDIWVLSASSDMSPPHYFCECLWFGPTADGMMEVQFIEGRTPAASSPYGQGGGGGGRGRGGRGYGGRGGGLNSKGRPTYHSYDEDDGYSSSHRGPPKMYHAVKCFHGTLLLQLRDRLRSATQVSSLPLLPTILAPSPPTVRTVVSRTPHALSSGDHHHGDAAADVGRGGGVVAAEADCAGGGGGDGDDGGEDSLLHDGFSFMGGGGFTTGLTSLFGDDEQDEDHDRQHPHDGDQDVVAGREGDETGVAAAAVDGEEGESSSSDGGSDDDGDDDGMDPEWGCTPFTWTLGTATSPTGLTGASDGALSSMSSAVASLVEPPEPPKLIMPALSELSRHELDSALHDLTHTMRLNQDQIQVLKAVVGWFDPRPDPAKPPPSPIILVHGVFGSGKSHLLAAMCLLVDRIAKLQERAGHGSRQGGDERATPCARVLLSAFTNVAVDRVLSQLQEEGFSDMVRVGSQKRVKSSLQEFLFSANDGAPVSTSSAADKQGTARQLQRLRSARVVGVTCASCPTLQAALTSDSAIPIVIIDEASQLPEPHTLMPLLAAHKPARLLMVGDPQQLPPQLAHAMRPSSSSSSSGATTSSDDATLQRPMFVRLAASVPPIMLRTQYRCHPMLSGLASDLFYRGQLVDGISAQDRAPVAAGLPPLAWLDARNGCEQQVGGDSFWNPGEAALVVQVLTLFTTERPDGRPPVMAPDDIGVIVPYRAQAAAVARGMKEKGLSSLIQVSTVDAFQGAEREMMLYSCVRTGGLGFLDSPSRLNVAITRAKRHLIIIGKREFLRSEDAGSSAMWTAIVRRAAPFNHPQEIAAILMDSARQEQEPASVE